MAEGLWAAVDPIQTIDAQWSRLNLGPASDPKQTFAQCYQRDKRE